MDALVETQPHTEHPLNGTEHRVVTRGRQAAMGVHEAAIEVALQQASDWFLVIAKMHPVELLLNTRLKTHKSTMHVDIINTFL